MTTHRHWDHWQALAEVQAGDRRRGRRAPRRRRRASGHGHQPGQPRRHGPVGSTSISVIHLRGHTPGSIALCYDAGGALADTPHLFTGDSLFPGGPGNTEHDPKRFSQLMDDLEDRVFGALPDGTWVYPGHGKDTTLGTERPHVPSGAPAAGSAAVAAGRGGGAGGPAAADLGGVDDDVVQV